MASRHPCLSLAPAPRITFPRHPGCGAGGSSPKSEGRLDPARDIKCESFDIPPRFDPERPGLAPPRVSNLFRKQMFTFHQQFQRIPGKFVDLKVFTTVAWLSASRYRFPTSDPDDRKNSWLERLRCTTRHQVAGPAVRQWHLRALATRIFRRTAPGVRNFATARPQRPNNFRATVCPVKTAGCWESPHRKASATGLFTGDRLLQAPPVLMAGVTQILSPGILGRRTDGRHGWADSESVDPVLGRPD